MQKDYDGGGTLSPSSPCFACKDVSPTQDVRKRFDSCREKRTNSLHCNQSRTGGPADSTPDPPGIVPISRNQTRASRRGGWSFNPPVKSRRSDDGAISNDILIGVGRQFRRPDRRSARGMISAAIRVGNVPLSVGQVRVVVGVREQLLHRQGEVSREEVLGGAVGTEGKICSRIEVAVAIGLAVGKSPSCPWSGRENASTSLIPVA